MHDGITCVALQQRLAHVHVEELCTYRDLKEGRDTCTVLQNHQVLPANDWPVPWLIDI